MGSDRPITRIDTNFKIHSKSSCDGIGGTVKRSVDKASLQEVFERDILTPEDMIQYEVYFQILKNKNFHFQRGPPIFKYCNVKGVFTGRCSCDMTSLLGDVVASQLWLARILVNVCRASLPLASTARKRPPIFKYLSTAVFILADIYSSGSRQLNPDCFSLVKSMVNTNIPKIYNCPFIHIISKLAHRASKVSMDGRIVGLMIQPQLTGYAGLAYPRSLGRTSSSPQGQQGPARWLILARRASQRLASQMANAGPKGQPKVVGLMIQSQLTEYAGLANPRSELGERNSQGSDFPLKHQLSHAPPRQRPHRMQRPTRILDARSPRMFYGAIFAESIADHADPRDRMVQVLKWYLSAFHAGRKSEVAKKPYNPIIGEVFKCYWDVPGSEAGHTYVEGGPVPWATEKQLSFIAEQVSHHPPISAFYAEHKAKNISFCGHIWTKSKFLGLSVCVLNIGQGCVCLVDRNEEYIINFPSGYGRSILTVPWVELGGSCQITCSKTGYNAQIEFLTKPFYGGKKHRVTAEVFSPGEKKAFLNVDGEWNGAITAKWNDGRTEMFVDTTSTPIIKKNAKPVVEQEENESRRLWLDVTYGLRFDQIPRATAGKCKLEQKQRNEAKERKEKNEDWETKLFTAAGDNWVYNSPLQGRIEYTAGV
ncbi:unnamed protein product [Meganyctiphanes norvegica]|uniref:Oxysterol-binding protein n=1 Tax=Meganyctiphanes norvegica TaxID=48144 RepID=A0AAV2QCM1_MEGNR